MKRLLSVLVLMLVLFLVFAPVVGAQGAPPTLPTLEQLLAMSLRAVGALVCISLFGYFWGYLISAIAARLPAGWSVPSWTFDLAILLPTAAVAGAWNAFASFINATFPGALDKTVGDALLWLANWLMTMFFSRRGGIAQVTDLARLGIQSSKSVKDGALTVTNARSGVLFVK